MRKRWAQWFAALTGVLLTGLAVAFAAIQNAGPNGEDDTKPQAAEAHHTAQAEAGKKIYDAQGCARCHAIAGQGNPRTPLDGVAERLSAGEIRMWVVASPELKDVMAPRVFQAKQAYQSLSAEELDALVAYLASK